MGSADFNVQSEDLRSVMRDLRKFSPELAKEMRKNLLAAAQPVVEEVRSAARDLPSKGEIGSSRKKKGQHLGLRQSLAAATQARVIGDSKSARIEIRVSSSRFEQVSGRPNSLVFYMEGLSKRWRHPLFGNRDWWENQDAHPYFLRSVRSGRADSHFVGAVDRALMTATNKIAE